SEPLYFLPWPSDAIVQMALPLRGTAGAGVPDPDVFFTAPINGCSIFFTVNSAAPTVYHAGTQDESLGMNSGKFWRNLFRELNVQSAKVQGKNTFGEVKMSQYRSALSPGASKRRYKMKRFETF